MLEQIYAKTSDDVGGVLCQGWQSQEREEGHEREVESGEGEGSSAPEKRGNGNSLIQGIQVIDGSWIKIIKVISRGFCLVRCKCGTEKEMRKCDLKRVLSCGCKKLQPTHTITHGLSKTPEHRVWSHMKARCHTPTDAGYYKYGAKGVTVCDRWRFSFENFLSDMGKRPSPTHSIDRIDVYGHYEPSNCRWATIDEQSNNKRTSIKTVWKGVEMSLAEICKMENMHYGLANSRVYALGWTVEDAVLIPKNGSRNGRNKYKQKHAKGSVVV